MENKEFISMMKWCFVIGFFIANSLLWFVNSNVYAGSDYSLPIVVLIFEIIIIIVLYLEHNLNCLCKNKSNE